MTKRGVQLAKKDELITYFICRLKLLTLVEYEEYRLKSPRTRFILNKLSYEDITWLNETFIRRPGD